MTYGARASEVTLLELANAYRMMASGVHTEPYVLQRSNIMGRGYLQPSLALLFDQQKRIGAIDDPRRIARLVRLPSGTAHALDARNFPNPGDG